MNRAKAIGMDVSGERFVSNQYPNIFGERKKKFIYINNCIDNSNDAASVW